ncbi:MAG: dihydroorotase [Candidatus Omnitrophica bacterium]|jgi:dihydroorotase|nr:dihydroorotase [Candidatus Omnitrophota bacterium]
MKLLIKSGRVIDPANNIDSVLDVLIENGKVACLQKEITSKADKIIDASAKIVIPGIVDMHVHLREPGREDKETVASGTQAALKGGVTSLLAMPNTCPAIDSSENAELLKGIIKKSAQCNVLISAAITKSRLGKEITDIAGLKKSGAIAITDDGASVDDEKIFLKALQKAAKEKILVIAHCEDKALSKNGVVNLGFISTKLGLRGISRESEYLRVERDIGLAQKAKAAIHIAHVSCKESVEIIAKAKKKGITVTCETAPHYFTLSEEDVVGYDTNMKINPPLRAKEDLAAIREGLRSGIIDAIASDHAPHTENEKDIEFDRAEFGKIGLESGLAVCVQELIGKQILDWPELVRKISLNPAKILGVDKGQLSVGQDADIIIIDPAREFILTKETIVSKSKNSPFLGRKVKGVVEYTILSGKIVYEEVCK